MGSDAATVTSSTTPTPVPPKYLMVAYPTAPTAYNASWLTLTDRCGDGKAVRVTCAAPTCGLPSASSIAPYIIGGDVAAEGQWPWLAALQYNGVFECGAVVVDGDWIATAAHCITKNGKSLVDVPQYFTARVGTDLLSGPSDHLRLVGFRRIVVHPNFTLGSDNIPHYDVAMMQIAGGALVFDDYVRPLCLAGSPALDPLCYVAGWGYEVPSYGLISFSVLVVLFKKIIRIPYMMQKYDV